MVKVGVIGSAGYTAGELIRLLVHHPKVELDFAYSTSNAGNQISDVHQDLLGTTHLCFTNTVNLEVDVVFLCLGHGNSKSFLQKNHFSKKTVIIDLSNDFRLKKEAHFEGKEFVYGLPELQKENIQQAKYIANPGCFATAIQLALLPLAKAKKITNEVHINAVTGATGAGVSLTKTTHFAWRTANFSYYKPFVHQHLDEIRQSLYQLQKKEVSELCFLPNRGDFARGIFATAYTHFNGTLEEAQEMYKAFYQNAKFTFVSNTPIHLKQVVNTNKCIIHLHKHNNKLLITSCIDNLLKGASGQAVQNMNLLFGGEEAEGLHLKASSF